MTRTPLMPKATAVWLVDNTSLTFEQIAEFCGLHVLEVKGIADGDVAHGIKGMDPISSGQLSREEIANAEEEPKHRLKLSEPKVEVPEVKTKRGPRYTPGVAPPGPAERHPVAVAQSPRAQGQPDHAAGRHHQADHPRHPRAHPLELAEPSGAGPGDARPLLADRPRRRREAGGGAARARAQKGGLAEPAKAGTLLPTEETTAGDPAPAARSAVAADGHGRTLAQEARDAMAAPEEVEEAPDADSVFAKLKDLKHDRRPVGIAR